MVRQSFGGCDPHATRLAQLTSKEDHHLPRDHPPCPPELGTLDCIDTTLTSGVSLGSSGQSAGNPLDLPGLHSLERVLAHPLGPGPYRSWDRIWKLQASD